MSLRLKLLLAASLLLAVPLAGYRFVLEMESFLRQRQGEAAADAARTLALAVESRTELLPATAAALAPGPDLYVHPLAGPLLVDGYSADWGELAPAANADGAAAVRAGWHGEWLYLLLVRPRPAPAAPMRLILEDGPEFRRAWLLDATTPGELVAAEVPPAAAATAPAHRDARVQAAAQHGAAGAVLEIRLPLALRAPRLGFEVLDAASNALASHLPREGSWLLVLPPAGLDRLLQSLAPAAGRRIRVTDTAGRVLAQAGGLASGAGEIGRMEALLQGLLAADDDALLSLAPSTLLLSGPELDSALSGVPARRVRRGDDDGPLVISAAHPLAVDGRLAGALVLEESTSPIQSLGRRAMLELLGATAGAFLAASAVLLLVAGRAVARMRALRDQAAGAVDSSGRVRSPFSAPAGNDEIGDLGRSFAAAVSRLQGYQEYLEQLARRLSHELRTPLAVIRSSLDNLQLRQNAPDPVTARAMHGVDRLDDIIRRMSEAARLEQAMADGEREVLDLNALLRAAVQGYAQAWGTPALRTRLPAQTLTVLGSPELLLQALDKLLANARDFARPDTPVTVVLERAGDHAHLAVHNFGPPLPAGDHARLFDSMVSGREHRGSDTPHLGLGLYVVRLVAEFHDGRALATDVDAGGVSVGMLLPLARRDG